MLTQPLHARRRQPGGAPRDQPQLADLVGAVRLPTGAHRRAAGTDALTDLLILRRREPAAPPRRRELGDHPRRSTSTVAGGQDQQPTWPTVPSGSSASWRSGTACTAPRRCSFARAERSDDAPRAAARRCSRTVARQRARRTIGPRRSRPATSRPPRRARRRPRRRRVAAQPPIAPRACGTGTSPPHPDGTFTVVNARCRMSRSTCPRTHRVELRRCSSCATAPGGCSAAEAASARGHRARSPSCAHTLRGRYGAYAARYGPINRFTLRRTGRIDPDTGEERMARVTPPAVRLLALGPVRGARRGARGLRRRLPDRHAGRDPRRAGRRRRARRGSAPTAPQDALAICLDTHGRVELDEIARLLGVDRPDARAQLGELVYHDPDRGRLVPAAEYLSGNVRAKLDLARAGSRARPGAARSTSRALERVLPRGADRRGDRAAARRRVDRRRHPPRSSSPSCSRTQSIQVEHPGGAIWAVKGRNCSVKATSEWGTSRMPGARAREGVLEQRPIQVTDEIDDGERTRASSTRPRPPPRREGARAAGALRRVVLGGPRARPADSPASTTARFNSLVLRDYTAEGERLTLPGLARTFTPLAHQRAAVARMLSEPAVGLFHQVGAGKTAEMVIGASELRRLGMVKKPAVVVPNHMLEQFAREWLQLYPQARVLAASGDDLAGEKRRAFVARAAANDWDAIIMTRSAFQRLPVSPPRPRSPTRARELDQLRAMLERARGERGLTVKRLEKIGLRVEERLQAAARRAARPWTVLRADRDRLPDRRRSARLQEPADDLATFRDAAIDGSKRATDLHMKTRVPALAPRRPRRDDRDRHPDREQHHRGARDEPAICGPTCSATPGSRTSTRGRRRSARPSPRSRWPRPAAATTACTPASRAFRTCPRCSRMWHVFADVKTADDLKLPTPSSPQRPDGQRAPQTDPDPRLTEISRRTSPSSAQRAERVRSRAVTPEEDNMLKITTDGRKAALDMRLVSGEPSSHHQQARRRRRHDRRDVARAPRARLPRLRRPASARRSPGRCRSCSATSPPQLGALERLRRAPRAARRPRRPARAGPVHPRGRATTREKARLFAACRAGHVAVIVGSTEKMGVGTNIQDRCVALHHLDCPWRPGRHRAARRPRRTARQPEPRDPHLPLRRRGQLRRLQLADRRAQSPVHQPGDARPPRRPRDRGHRREHPLLRRGQSPRLRRPADPRQSPRRRRRHPLSRASSARGSETSTRSRHASPPATTACKPSTASSTPSHAAIAHRHDTRGERFQMTVDGRHVDTRADAADASRPRAATHRARADRCRSETLGGLRSTARSASTRTQSATSSSRFTACPAARPPSSRRRLADSSLSLVRQLEHRLDDLPASRPHPTAARDRAPPSSRAHANSSPARSNTPSSSPTPAHADTHRASDESTRSAAPRRRRPPPHAADIDAALRAAFPAPANTALARIATQDRREPASATLSPQPTARRRGDATDDPPAPNPTPPRRAPVHRR